MKRLLAIALLAGCAGAPVEEPVADALVEAEDEECATDCSDDEGPPHIAAAKVATLVAEWMQQPMRDPSLPLETLLFHGHHTTRGLELLDDDALPKDRRDYLLSELNRDRAAIEVRLVDESGAVRATLDADGLALGIGSHIHMHDTGSLGDIEMSGRVRRVGLHHLWSRW